jgi:lysophospholipase L1-like esterase
MKANSIFAALVVVGALLANGCTDTAPSGPSASLGSVTVTKYVAIGNSLTAGYQSGSLFVDAQTNSFTNLIAGQLNVAGASIGTFQQPLIANPGTPGRMELVSLVGPQIFINPASGAPLNIALPRPYDNLGVPGATIYDFMNATDSNTCASAVSGGSPNPLFNLILRGIGTQYTQAKLLNPNLVTFWLGNNDVLGFATSGGTSPTAPTPSTTFAALYAQAVGSLHTALPNAKILVGNIPDVKAIPFFTTVGPKIAAGIPAGVYLRYQMHGNKGVAFDSTRLTESGAPLITLKASAYAALLGYPTGQWYRDLAAYLGIPVAALYPTYQAAGIDTTKPFGFHPQNPFPDALVLDAGEQATAAQSISDFNTTIAGVAQSNNATVVDMNGFFAKVKASGVVVDGETFTTAYIAGNLFSLDGVHPSSKGEGIVANQFIKTMNASFGMHVPYVNINLLPGIPTTNALSKLATYKNIPIIPYNAWKGFNALWGSGF